MYLERIKFVCEMVTKLWVFKHSPLVLKIAPTTTLKCRHISIIEHPSQMDLLRHRRVNVCSCVQVCLVMQEDKSV